MDSRSRRPPPSRRPGNPARGTRGLDQWLGGATVGPLASLQAGVAVANRSLQAARQVLPADLVPHLWAANCVDREFSLLFESAAWATRARYAAAAWCEPLAQAMGEPVEKVTVKVRPRG